MLEQYLDPPAQSAAQGLLVATAGAIVFTLVANAAPEALFPKKTLVMGSPRWTAYSAIFFQAVVYPYCLYRGLGDATGGTYDLAAWYSTGSMLDFGRYWERVYLFLFWLNLVKDFFGPVTMLFVVHHITCMFAIGVGLFAVDDAGVIFAVGTYAFEFGSLFYNIWTLLPKNGLVRPLYFAIFPLSNVVALYHLYRAFWLRNPGAWYSYAFLVIGPVLALMRQLECNQDIKGRLPTYGVNAAAVKKED